MKLAHRYGLTVEQLAAAKLVPAGPRVVKSLVERLLVHYPGRKGEVDTAILVADWDATLANYPEDLLWRGFTACLKTLKFFPTLAEFLAFVEADYRERRSLVRPRMDTRQALPPAPLSKDEFKRVLDTIARIKAGLSEAAA